MYSTHFGKCRQVLISPQWLIFVFHVTNWTHSSAQQLSQCSKSWIVYHRDDMPLQSVEESSYSWCCQSSRMFLIDVLKHQHFSIWSELENLQKVFKQNIACNVMCKSWRLFVNRSDWTMPLLSLIKHILWTAMLLIVKGSGFTRHS